MACSSPVHTLVGLLLILPSTTLLLALHRDEGPYGQKATTGNGGAGSNGDTGHIGQANAPIYHYGSYRNRYSRNDDDQWTHSDYNSYQENLNTHEDSAHHGSHPHLARHKELMNSLHRTGSGTGAKNLLQRRHSAGLMGLFDRMDLFGSGFGRSGSGGYGGGGGYGNSKGVDLYSLFALGIFAAFLGYLVFYYISVNADERSFRAYPEAQESLVYLAETVMDSVERWGLSELNDKTT